MAKIEEMNKSKLNDSQVAQPGNNGGKRKNCCKRISKFLFSHIGLVLTVIIYSVLGGFLFELLEQHEEIKMCEKGKGVESSNIVGLRSKLLTYIQFNITSNPMETSKDNETVANSNIEKWLQEFRNQTHDVKSTYRYTGNDCNSPKWTFPGALLFAVTAITTIGYGHITPVTWEGQIVCICYATIGIPFFLMCVANISGVLGDMFRFIYSRICCRLCYNKKKKARASQNQFEAGDNTTRATDVVPAWGMDGDMNGKPLDRIKSGSTNDPRVVDDPEKLDDEDEDKVTVPLTVTMIIITAYIGLGAVLFSQFEGWTPIQSAYFCYITLATIGFGDFVPGQKENDPYAGVKLIAGAVYVLIGMSIIAMCFDLMQEEIIAKFTWLGKKVGIVEEEQQDPDNDVDNYTEINDFKKEKAPNNFDAQNTNNNNNMNNFGNANNNIGRLSKNSTIEEYPSRTGSTEPLQKNNDLMNKFRSAYLQNVVQRPQQKP